MIEYNVKTRLKHDSEEIQSHDRTRQQHEPDKIQLQNKTGARF